MSLALKGSEFSAGLTQANQQAAAFARQFRATVGGGLGQVEQQARSFSQRFQGSINSMLTGVQRYAKQAMAGLGLAVAAGFAMAVRSAIQTNAQLETTRLQFTTLMGSAEQAEEHVASLFEIAKKTPFETGPIIQASLKLQTFGGAALNTRDNILLLGDAAAATNAPIDELGFWVGRLYSNIQAGQPFGEAAMRLQELAVMSPQARQEMEALQKSGAAAAEVFGVFQEDLTRFTGAMEKQASTWSGLGSTLSDQATLLIGEGMQNAFEAAKGELQEIVTLLDDPDIAAGIRSAAEALGEAAAGLAQVIGFAAKEVAGAGLEKQNRELIEMLGLTQKEIAQVEKLARLRSGTGIFTFGKGENLAQQEAGLAILQEQYGLIIRQAEGYRALTEARMEDARSIETYVAATQQEQYTVEELARLQAWAEEAQRRAAEATTERAEWLARATDWVSDAQGRARAADYQREQSLRAVAEATAAAAAEAEAYAQAFQAVQGDYVTQLPGADQPLVTPARDVAITTGGLTPAQVDLLEQYQEAAQKAQQEIFNLTNGLGTYGLEQEKVNERVAEAQGELEHYRALMAPLEGIVGTTSVAHQAMAVNVGAARQAIYDQLVQMGAAPEVVTAYGVAIGIMSEEQRTAALTAAAVKIETERLAQLIAEGMPVEQALADLDKFIAKIEGGLAPAVLRAAADVPAGIVRMKEEIAEEALLAGQGLMTGLESGVTENVGLATEAAEGAAGQVIDSTAAALGVESPSTITHQMGLDLMAGMQNGAQAGMAAVVSAVTTIGGNIVAGLVAGINGAKQLVLNAIQGIADAIPDWLAQFIQMGSPAKVTIPHGRAVGEGMAVGVIYSAGTLKTALGKLTSMLLAELDLGDQIAGIAGGFMARFEEQITGPMAERLGELDGQLGGVAALFTETMRDAGRDDVFADWTDPTEAQRALRQMAELRATLATSGDWLGMMQIDDAMRALRERNELNAEYVQQQERLERLQRAQADMAFLQSQVELLALIAEHAEELPANLLEGVQFGSEADPGALMDAMTAVIERQVAAVNDALAESRPLQQVLTEGLDAPEFIKQIRPAKEEWRDFTGAVKGFDSWLRGRTLKLDVRIGEIPEWAIPGSPLPIHTAWVNFAEAMQHLYFGDQLVGHFGRVAASGDLLMTFLLSMPEELAGLTEDINAIVFQNYDAFAEYFAIVQAGGQGLQDLLDAFAAYAEGEPLGDLFQELLGSFPEEFLPFLEQLAQMVADGVDGVEEYIASLVDLAGAVGKLEDALDLAREVGNLAQGFGNYFEIQVIRPLEEQLDGMNDVLGGMMGNLQTIVTQQFGGSLDLSNILDLPTDQAIRELQGVRHALVAAGSAAGQTQVDAMIAMLVERNRLEREYEEQQERILRLEEQRAQLAFLQQQLDLIRLVMEEGLDASLLAGLQFGLNADAGQLMDVMADVMQQLIVTAQNELMIHSPSRPFFEFGQNLANSLALGVEDQADGAKRRLQAVMGELHNTTEDFEGALKGGEAFGDPRIAAGRAGRIIINGGYNVTIAGSDGDALEQLQRQTRGGRSLNQRLVEVI